MRELLDFTFLPASIRRGDESSQERFTEVEMNDLLEKFPVIKDCPRTLGGNYTFVGEADSEVTKELITQMEAMGKRFRFNRGVRPDGSSIAIGGCRKFDDTDMAEAEFFHIYASDMVARENHQATMDAGYTVLSTEDFKRIPLGHTGPQARQILCSEILWRDMAAEGFKGLTGQEVMFAGKNPKFAEVRMLGSDIVLPPLQNELRGYEYEVLEGYRKTGTVEISDVFFPPLLQYKRSELEEVGEFDVAITYERLGSVPPSYQGDVDRLRFPGIICSRRFKDWCISKKLKVMLVPVSLED
ncbi:hypothetical protein Rhal01_00649 [Rubritalea halochordaticola]|uniref:Uncharacterized protein n=1 Tax=Rubritalea halochordaticola TaxID=714537 RepID=A0ABP9UW90_9BACT